MDRQNKGADPIERTGSIIERNDLKLKNRVQSKNFFKVDMQGIEEQQKII